MTEIVLKGSFRVTVEPAGGCGAGCGCPPGHCKCPPGSCGKGKCPAGSCGGKCPGCGCPPGHCKCAGGGCAKGKCGGCGCPAGECKCAGGSCGKKCGGCGCPPGECKCAGGACTAGSCCKGKCSCPPGECKCPAGASCCKGKCACPPGECKCPPGSCCKGGKCGGCGCPAGECKCAGGACGKSGSCPGCGCPPGHCKCHGGGCHGHAGRAHNSSGIILVLGATGNNGAATARALARRGVHFRAAVRNPAKAESIRSEFCELVEVNYADPATLSRAMENVEKLYMVQAGAMGTEDQVVEGKRIVDCAAAAGVRHIVKLSALGTQHPRRLTYGREHWEVERYIRMKGLQLTSLRPSSFHSNFVSMDTPTIKGQNATFNIIPDDVRMNYVSVDDNGEAAAVCLTTPDHEGNEYYLTGPDTLSQAEVAALISRVIGRQINHVQIPIEGLRSTLAGFGMPPPTVEGMVNLFQYFADGLYDFHAHDLELLLGRKAQNLEDYLRANAAAFNP